MRFYHRRLLPRFEIYRTPRVHFLSEYLIHRRHVPYVRLVALAPNRHSVFMKMYDRRIDFAARQQFRDIFRSQSAQIQAIYLFDDIRGVLVEHPLRLVRFVFLISVWRHGADVLPGHPFCAQVRYMP